ncbi:Tubulin/FtsZ, GTPase domain-containing protein [Cladochytrium replicatum]|nr:Tubulin/FtsZ, GTPase domain-containing protein [Cladochytrium replicatum]
MDTVVGTQRTVLVQIGQVQEVELALRDKVTQCASGRNPSGASISRCCRKGVCARCSLLVLGLNAACRVDGAVDLSSSSFYTQVVVDTEHKTWVKDKQKSAVTSKSNNGRGPYYVENGSYGRANNWAEGYWGQSNAQPVIDILRRTCEQNEKSYCMLAHSTAGGTGSGFGSHLLEEIRDQFPRLTIMDLAITPFSSGETALQHYNTVLSLSWAHRYADMVTVFSNDSVMAALARRAPKARISMGEVNKYIAGCVSDFVLPRRDVQLRDNRLIYSRRRRLFELRSLVGELVPNKECNFCFMSSSTLPSVSEDNSSAFTQSWDDLASQLIKNTSGSGYFSEKQRYLASALVARGVESADFWGSVQRSRLASNTQTDTRCLSPAVERIRSKVDGRLSSTETCGGLGNERDCDRRSMSLGYNSTDILPILDPTIDRAMNMFQAGAYVHWYTKFALRSGRSSAKSSGAAAASNDFRSIFAESMEELITCRDAYDSFRNP